MGATTGTTMRTITSAMAWATIMAITITMGVADPIVDQAVGPAIIGIGANVLHLSSEQKLLPLK